MLLLLRCDSGGRLGIGHAVRCLALAEAARDRGHRVRWCGRLDDLCWLRAETGPGERGAPEEPEEPVLPDGAAVLPGEDDPARLVALAREIGADVLHADHYGLGPGLRGALNPAGVLLSNVEDSGHGRRPADLVVDPNLGAETHCRPDDGSPVLLRGLDYALLRGAVRQAREIRATLTGAGGDPPRVLVVMGGTDAAGLLDPVLTALRAAAVPAEVDVIVPDGRELPAGGPVRLRPSPPRADLPRLMARADLVISAAGTTVWELCCVGVPMALVCAADNQAEGYHALLAAGAAAGLGGPAGLADGTVTAGNLTAGTLAAGTLRALLRDGAARARLARRAAGLVDGQGAGRVVTALEQLVDGPVLRARPARRCDAELLYAWRNDATTRRWSRSREVVGWPDHLRWFEAGLHRPDRLLLVVENTRPGPAGSTPVGTVRWDRQADTWWEVSITVAPPQRGRGLAALVLRSGEQSLVETHGPGVQARAHIHQDNRASLKLFSRAGYTADGLPDPAGFVPYRKFLG